MDGAPRPTDPAREQAAGRLALWLDVDSVRWLAEHCLCGRGAEGSHTFQCKWIRHRAETLLHKEGLKEPGHRYSR